MKDNNREGRKEKIMAAKRGGLGKGLDSLIPDNNLRSSGEKTKIVEKIVEKPELMVKISKVGPNKDQPRKQFNEDALMELADSIKQFGVLQPLLVQEKNGFYEIIAGERRWRAAKMAGLKEVPVIVKNYTDLEIIEIALIENIQRENLNPIEEAQAYKRLLTEFHMKQDELAERVSKSRTAITNSMRLLKLDERIQQMVIDDMISSGHARALLSIENKDVQYTLAVRIFDEKLSVREVEKLVKKIQAEEPEKNKENDKRDDSFIYKDIEEKMKLILGTKVCVTHKKNNKGKIEIEYYSNEELERLIEMFETLQGR